MHRDGPEGGHAPEEAAGTWAGASWWEQEVFWPDVSRRREEARRRGGLRLIVTAIVVLTSIIAVCLLRVLAL